MTICSRLLFCIVVSAGLAFADRFTFSYTFATGNSISGIVDGDLLADQNTVVNIRNMSAAYSREPNEQLTFISPFFNVLKLNAVGIQFAGFQVVPTGPAHPDFGFLLIDDGFPCANCSTVGIFDVASDHITAPLGANQFEAQPIDRSKWSAVPVSVPEPAELTITGFLLGAIGFLSRYRSCKPV